MSGPSSAPSSRLELGTADSRRHRNSFVRYEQPRLGHLNPPVRPLRARKVIAATENLVELYGRCSSSFQYNPEHNPRRVLTRPDEGVHNNGYDNARHDYILHVNDVLSSPAGDEYVVIDLLGTGTFGQVVKCRHRGTGQIVAVKVIKNDPAYSRQALMELNILKMIHERNSAEEVKHIVMLLGEFEFRSHLCLVFEKLSINLFELIKQNKYKGLGLGLLRSFVRQILRTLEVLARSGVIHCDLKPENILLKNLNSTMIKIIDFGSACLDDQVVYSYVQSRFYRSPEVLLSMKYDSKIDVWSLGCIAGELFLGLPLFPGSSESNMVYRITEMIGIPSSQMLHQCERSEVYFTVYHRGGRKFYLLKSEEQFSRERDADHAEWKRYFSHKKLRDIVMNAPYRSVPTPGEVNLREIFADFLSQLLRIDPMIRWSPMQAMRHPFIDDGVAVASSTTAAESDRDPYLDDEDATAASEAPANARTNDESAYHGNGQG